MGLSGFAWQAFADEPSSTQQTSSTAADEECAITFQVRYPAVPGIEISDEELENGILMSGSAKGLPAPSEETKGRNMLGLEGVEITYPSAYEDIVLHDVLNGTLDPMTGLPFVKAFVYAEAGSSAAAYGGHYTIEWTKLSNDGSHYTMEGWAFLNYENFRNVAFYVAEPGFAGPRGSAVYTLQTSYMVPDGQRECDLAQPEMAAALERDGLAYGFIGWYQDKARISEAHFTSTIAANSFEVCNYYGAYERDYDIAIEYTKVVYDSSPHYASVEVPDDVVVYYAKENDMGSVLDDDWQTEPPSIANVGTEKWYVKAVAEDGTAIYKSFNLEIEKRPVTITAHPLRKIFGEDEPDGGKATLTIEGYESLSDQQKASINAELGSIDLSQGRGHPIMYNVVGVYQGAVAPCEGADSYEREFPNFAFTIVPADFTIVAASIAPEAGLVTIEMPAAMPYNGNEQKLAPLLKQGNFALVEGVDYDIVSYEGNMIDAGAVTVRLEGRGNYDTEGSTAEVSYTIARRPVTVTIPDLEYPILYGSSDQLPTPEIAIEGNDLTPEQRTVLEEKLAFITQTRVTVDGDGAVGDRNLVLADAVQQQLGEMADFIFTVHEGACTVDPGVEYATVVLDTPMAKFYDGQPLSPPEPRVLGPAWDGWPELQGYTFTYQVKNESGEWIDCSREEASLTDAGLLEVRARAEKPNYIPVTMDGSQPCYLQIYRRGVTISAEQPPEKSAKVFGTPDPEFDNATVTVDMLDTDGDLQQLQAYVEEVLGDIPVRRMNVSGGSVPEENASTVPYSRSLRPDCDISSLEASEALKNYALSLTGADFAITPADISVAMVSGLSDAVYKGEPYYQVPQLTYNDAMLQERVDYTFSEFPLDQERAGQKVFRLIGEGNFTGRLEVAYTISPRKVMVQLPDFELAYGSAVSNPIGIPVDFQVAQAADEMLPESLSQQVSSILNYTDSVVAPGEYDRLGTYEGAVILSESSRANLESLTNFVFMVTPGDLIVIRGEAANATIQLEGGQRVYNGAPLSVAAQVIGANYAPMEGFTFAYEYNDQFQANGMPEWDTWQPWAGEGAPCLDGVGKMAVRATAMHDCYLEITMNEWEYAVLEVTPCPVAITLDPAVITCKGFIDSDPIFPDALMSQPADLSPQAWDALQEGVDLRVSYRGNSNAGDKELSIGCSAEELNEAFPNFSFTVETRMFVINRTYLTDAGLSLSIPDTVDYAGEPVRVTPIITYERDGQVIALRENVDFTIDYIGSTTDVGVVGYTIEGIRNFEGSISGQYNIEQLSATIQVPDAEVLYGEELGELEPAVIMISGKPLNQCSAALQAAIGALNIDLDVVREGLPTALGVHEGALTISELAENLNGYQNNIEFTIEPGDLTIMALDSNGVALTVRDVCRMYNGELLSPDAQLDVDPAAGDGWSLEYSWLWGMPGQEAPDEGAQWPEWTWADPAFSGVGKIFIKVRAVCDGHEPVLMSVEQQGRDYVIVEVVKRPVILTAPDAQKVYGQADPDFGEALIEFGGDELTDGQKAALEEELRRDGMSLKVKRAESVSEDAGVYEGGLVLNKSQDELNYEPYEPIYYPVNYSFTVVPGTFTILPA